MLLTFVAYSLLAGILASMSTNAEDYQQVQVPIVIVLLLGYYLSIMAGMFKGALFIKVLSFVPFISAILSPSLLVMGQIGVIEVLISVVLMIVTIYLLIKYGLRVYKVGILSMISLLIHNIPEGIMTFITSSNNLKIGITLSIAIALHNIPEGITISIPIYYSTKSKFKAFLYTLISGLSEPFGAIIAYLFLKNIVGDITLGLLYSLIAGMMVNISINELKI